MTNIALQHTSHAVSSFSCAALPTVVQSDGNVG